MASHRMYPRHLCLVADSSDKPIPTRWETNWPCGPWPALEFGQQQLFVEQFAGFPQPFRYVLPRKRRRSGAHEHQQRFGFPHRQPFDFFQWHMGLPPAHCVVLKTARHFHPWGHPNTRSGGTTQPVVSLGDRFASSDDRLWGLSMIVITDSKTASVRYSRPSM